MNEIIKARIRAHGVSIWWAALIAIPLFFASKYGGLWIQDHGHQIIEDGTTMYSVRTVTVLTEGQSIASRSTHDIENMATGEQWHQALPHPFNHRPRGREPSKWRLRDFDWKPDLPEQWPPGLYLSRLCRTPVSPLPFPFNGPTTPECSTSTFEIEGEPQ